MIQDQKYAIHFKSFEPYLSYLNRC